LDKDLFTKPEGIFGGEGMSFIYILGAIFIASMVGNIFAKEYENKTIEYLIVKPLSRKDIFIQKLLCLISYTILLNLIFTFVMLIEFKLLVNYPYNQNVLIAFGYYSFVSQFFFLGISMISSIFFQKSSMNTLISLAVVIYMYFGNTLAKMSEKLILISRMSIYNYIPITDTIIEGKFYYVNGLFIIFISLILMAVSYLIFIKKDIKID
jgi:ABC-2 type transport system permease protein